MTYAQEDPNKKKEPNESPGRQSSPEEWTPGRTLNPEIDPGEHAPERPEVPPETTRIGAPVREHSLE